MARGSRPERGFAKGSRPEWGFAKGFWFFCERGSLNVSVETHWQQKGFVLVFKSLCECAAGFMVHLIELKLLGGSVLLDIWYT